MEFATNKPSCRVFVTMGGILTFLNGYLQTVRAVARAHCLVDDGMSFGQKNLTRELCLKDDAAEVRGCSTALSG
jgi:hypothetical protein